MVNRERNSACISTDNLPSLYHLDLVRLVHVLAERNRRDEGKSNRGGGGHRGAGRDAGGVGPGRRRCEGRASRQSGARAWASRARGTERGGPCPSERGTRSRTEGPRDTGRRREGFGDA